VVSNKSALNYKPTICDGVIFALCVVSFFLWGYLVFSHNTFGEWDGVLQYYAGKEMLYGQGYKGWASHFWPPLQPLLLALGNPFVIGKTIAVVSGFIILAGSYGIARVKELSIRESLLVTAVLGSNQTFLFHSSIVENHALEASMSVLGLYFALLFFKKAKSRFKPPIAILITAALFVGVAGLTRYTAYALALAIALSLLFLMPKIKEKFLYTSIFSLVFIGISLVWWVPNYIMNGSPLATWHYVNVGSNIHPGGVQEFWWIHVSNYTGMFEVISDFFKEFVIGFLKNIFNSLKILATSLTSVNIISLVVTSLGGLYLVITGSTTNKLKSNFVGILYLMIYITVCSIALSFTSALFPVICIFILLFFIALSKQLKFFKICAIILIGLNLVGSYFAFTNFLDVEASDDGTLHSRVEVTNLLTEDPLINNKTVVSSHPARAYYANSQWLAFPLAGLDNTCDLINYSFDKKVKKHNPRIPVLLNVDNPEVNYIIVGETVANLYPFISDDFKFKEDSCSDSLNLILKNSGVSVYEVSKSL